MPKVKTIKKSLPPMKIRHRLKEVKDLKKNAEAKAYQYKVLNTSSLTPELLKQTKKLHAYVYLSKGFIDDSDIGPDGAMHESADPHQKHSDYFAVVDRSAPRQVLAAARQIRAHQAHDQLPILSQSRLHARHIRSIRSTKAQNIVEISALVKKPGVSALVVFELYLAMWATSLRSGHQMWLMACDTRLYRRLKILFGSAIVRIGKRTHYKGGDVIPCRLDLRASHEKILSNLRSRHILYGKVRRSMAQKFLQAYMDLENA